MLPRSIRWRILLWLAFLLVALLTGFGLTAYQLQQASQFSRLDETLKHHVAIVSADVRGRSANSPPPDRGPRRPPPDERDEDFGSRRPPPGFRDGNGGSRRSPPDRDRGGPRDRGPDGPPPDMRFNTRTVTISPQTLTLFADQSANAYYYAVWTRGGRLSAQSTNTPASLPRPSGSESDTRPEIRERSNFREAYHYTEMGDCILVGGSIEADLRALHQFAWWLVAAGAGILILGLGGGWWLASTALRPIDDMGAAAMRISEGDLSQRINAVETDSELGRLAGVLNATFARLEAAFAQQKQFTADASHELRTPLAVLISEAQTTLSRDRSTAEYRETVEACLAAAQQMRRLTDRLLQLARLDAGEGKLEGASIDLADCAAASVELVQPLAVQRGIRLGADLNPAKLGGDAELIGQVITNLLTNAIHYNRDNGEVRITTSVENGEAVLRVSDTGQGIGDADLPHIFKRFFRADKSRARANGRNGLGLAICKAIVDAHGGRIDVETELGKGATFTVRLPV